MNSRQRLQHALAHKEPDRVPFDLGSTFTTGIHVTAYNNLRRHLGLPVRADAAIFNLDQQIALVEEDLQELWGIDTQFVLPGAQSGTEFVIEQREDGEYFRNEWGLGFRKPRDGGFYFDIIQHPLKDVESVEALNAYPWPDPCAPGVHDGMVERVQQAGETGRGVAMAGFTTGMIEMASWLLGYERFYSAVLLEKEFISALLDRMLNIKLAYWEKTLSLVGQDIDILEESDDLGTQERTIFSPKVYQTLLKPRQKVLFDFIHSRTPAKIFFHSCGAVRAFIPDLIEVGIDILNPVQVSAAGMDTGELKREFGKDLTFWGGGVDTQKTLSQGTPLEVREDVRRRIEDLAPGGGFVFATVHNIQADVPPENLVAMWEALQEFGVY